ncbi:MAG TPA: ABC transporter ATP-binding protein [Ilumatobacter sp.]|nr:ABC transporter ATP-binding protein [Ilumatobacter sp.]
MTDAPLLQIAGVSRSFGDVTALDGVSIDVVENEFFALLGPSGCGKTTLLRILAGLEDPDAGTVTLAGDDLIAMPVHRRPINLMFQSFALFPHLNVEKNVAYGLQREKRPKDEIRERVAEALQTVGLNGLGRRRVTELSGGQRQRVALARAMVKRPRLLLLDEPLGALDKQIRSQMQIELKRLQNEVGITFIVVTHDQEEAMSMADRIAVLRDGHVEQIASPEDLFDRPATRFVAEFIGRTNIFEPRANGRLLSVRPERMLLDKEASSGGRLLTGTVRDVQFFGGVSHATIDVDHDADDGAATDLGSPATIVVATIGSTRIRPGHQTTITWHPESEVEIER